METSPSLRGILSEVAKSVFGVTAETSTLEHLGNISKKKASYFPIFKDLGFLLF